MQATVTGILNHPRKLGIRSVCFDVRRHPGKDGGCRDEGATFLATFVGQYKHAILMFDHEGCGTEDVASEALEAQISESLAAAGWRDNATTIILVPELDIWVWSDSPHVGAALGWRGRTPDLRQWLKDKEYLREGDSKPVRPKEAMEAALRVVRQPRSSAVYEELAGTVSYDRCTDLAFAKLKTTLRAWFPVEGQ
jgi:hypothetical protein